MAGRTASLTPALKWVRRVLLALLGSAALLIAAVSIWVALDDRVSFHPFAPDAGDLIDEVIAKSGLSTDDSDPVVRTEEDGTTPDMADRTLRLAQSPPSITAAVEHACSALKFHKPDADAKTTEPDLICQGEWKGDLAGVYLHTRCAETCTAFIQTQR